MKMPQSGGDKQKLPTPHTHGRGGDFDTGRDRRRANRSWSELQNLPRRSNVEDLEEQFDIEEFYHGRDTEHPRSSNQFDERSFDEQDAKHKDKTASKIKGQKNRSKDAVSGKSSTSQQYIPRLIYYPAEFYTSRLGGALDGNLY